MRRIGLIFALTLFWIGAGLSLDQQLTVIIGGFLSIAPLGILLWRHQPLLLPRHFIWWMCLVATMAVSIIWSDQRTLSWTQMVLVASGTLWWIVARSLHDNTLFRNVVVQSVLWAGVGFTLLWFLHVFSIWSLPYQSSSLVAEASSYKNHNHIGDWWMVMMTMQFSWEWVIPGMVMLWAARSRSAQVGLVIGVGYTAWLEHWLERYRKLVYLVLGIVLVTFVTTSSSKSTLGSRDYFVQAIAGLRYYPVGSGWGNFQRISNDTRTHWFGKNDYSTIVHCLPLEWMSGMGWLGILGIIWLGLTSWDFGWAGTKDRGIWRAAYWALLVNFCLDTTYFIPAMWWLWMIVIGLAEE
jgi:hypothetical protein